MYFAGKLVYLTVLASVQFAIRFFFNCMCTVVINSRWLYFRGYQFCGLGKNHIFVGFKICGHSTFLYNSYRKSLFRGN